MSLIPSFFGSRRSNILDLFSLEIWDPFKDFSFSSEPQFAKETSAFVNTRVDWKETPEAHVFKADLPGLNKEEVKKEEKKDTWHRVERSSGKFLRRFRLPENAKMDQINGLRGRGLKGFEGISTTSNPLIFNFPKLERFGGRASMENGVLTVTVPKVEVKKPDVKAIEISG
ncbi:hypothetical protein ACB092_08G071700 [Castanea dentata]